MLRLLAAARRVVKAPAGLQDCPCRDGSEHATGQVDVAAAHAADCAFLELQSAVTQIDEAFNGDAEAGLQADPHGGTGKPLSRSPASRPPASRPRRWQAACDLVRGGLDELQSLKDEYEEWRDQLPDNLAGSSVAEKLDEIVDGGFLDEIESGLDEAEGADLPLGFGRD